MCCCAVAAQPGPKTHLRVIRSRCQVEPQHTKGKTGFVVLSCFFSNASDAVLQSALFTFAQGQCYCASVCAVPLVLLRRPGEGRSSRPHGGPDLQSGLCPSMTSDGRSTRANVQSSCVEKASWLLSLTECPLTNVLFLSLTPPHPPAPISLFYQKCRNTHPLLSCKIGSPPSMT